MFHKSVPFRFITSALVLVVSFLLQSGVALAASGDVDLSFDPGSGPNADVYCVAALPDRKALIGGAFTSINGTNRNRIARLNPDGNLDPAFDPGQGANDLVIALVPLR